MQDNRNGGGDAPHDGKAEARASPAGSQLPSLRLGRRPGQGREEARTRRRSHAAPHPRDRRRWRRGQKWGITEFGARKHRSELKAGLRMPCAETHRACSSMWGRAKRKGPKHAADWWQQHDCHNNQEPDRRPSAQDQRSAAEGRVRAPELGLGRRLRWAARRPQSHSVPCETESSAAGVLGQQQGAWHM